MKQKKRASSFPLRLVDELRSWAENRAIKNKRSLNAELNLLIERAKEKEETEKA